MPLKKASKDIDNEITLTNVKSTPSKSSKSNTTTTTTTKPVKRDIHTPSPELLAYLKLVERVESLAETRKWKPSSSKNAKILTWDELYIPLPKDDQYSSAPDNNSNINNSDNEKEGKEEKVLENGKINTTKTNVKSEDDSSNSNVVVEPTIVKKKVEEKRDEHKEVKVKEELAEKDEDESMKKNKRLSSHLKQLKRFSSGDSSILDFLSNSTLSGEIPPLKPSPSQASPLQQKQQANNDDDYDNMITPVKVPTLSSIIEEDEEDEDIEFIILNSAKKKNRLNNKYFIPDDDDDDVVTQQTPSKLPSPQQQKHSPKTVKDQTPMKTPMKTPIKTPIKTDNETTNEETPIKTPIKTPIRTPMKISPQQQQQTTEEAKKEKEKQDKKDKQNEDSILEQLQKVTITPKRQDSPNKKPQTTAINTTIIQPKPIARQISSLTKEFRLTKINDDASTSSPNNNNNNISIYNNETPSPTLSSISTSSSSSSSTTTENTGEFINFEKVKSFYPIEPNNDKFNESMMCSPLNLETTHLPGVSQFFERDKKIHAISYFKRYNRTVFQNKFPEDMIIWSDEQLSTPGKTSITKKNDINLAKIILSTKLINSIETLANVLCHEMCHSATWMFDNSKKAHGCEFKFWVRIAQSQYPELSIDMCDNFKSSFAYHYKCQSLTCDVTFGRSTPNDELLYCGKCQSPIVPIEKVETESRFDKYLRDNFNQTKLKHPSLTPDEIKSIIQLRWRKAQFEEQKQKKIDKILKTDRIGTDQVQLNSLSKPLPTELSPNISIPTNTKSAATTTVTTKPTTTKTTPTITKSAATTTSTTTKPTTSTTTKPTTSKSSSTSSRPKIISVPFEDIPQIPRTATTKRSVTKK